MFLARIISCIIFLILTAFDSAEDFLKPFRRLAFYDLFSFLKIVVPFLKNVRLQNIL